MWCSRGRWIAVIHKREPVCSAAALRSDFRHRSCLSAAARLLPQPNCCPMLVHTVWHIKHAYCSGKEEWRRESGIKSIWGRKHLLSKYLEKKSTTELFHVFCLYYLNMYRNTFGIWRIRKINYSWCQQTLLKFNAISRIILHFSFSGIIIIP